MWNNPELFRTLLDNLHDGVYFVDRNRIITYWNRGAERLSGFEANEVLHKSCRDNILNHVDGQGTLLCLGQCPLAATIQDGQLRQAEAFLHHKAGHRLPVAIRTAPIRDDKGAIIGAVETFTDNSAQLADREQIRILQDEAYLDPLTGVANRRYLEIILHSRLEELVRYGWPFWVLFLDIDHFKMINDKHGHAVGDKVLSMVTKTMKGCSRSFDQIGRWGGEEFLVVVANISAHQIRGVAERLRCIIEQCQLPLPEGSLRVTVSIGGAAARAGDTAAELIHRADAAMYQSKLAGRNRVTYAS